MANLIVQEAVTNRISLQSRSNSYSKKLNMIWLHVITSKLHYFRFISVYNISFKTVKTRGRLGLRPRFHWGNLQRSSDLVAGAGGRHHSSASILAPSALLSALLALLRSCPFHYFLTTHKSLKMAWCKLGSQFLYIGKANKKLSTFCIAFHNYLLSGRR